MANTFGNPGNKSIYNAKKHLNKGNLLTQKGKFFEALESYNKSLCFAETRSPEIPLAYAGRSAVYFEVAQYELCLENIKLALDSKLAKHEVPALQDRQLKCNEMMKQSDETESPWNFFKLSYVPNKKIPFIVDCLQLNNDANFGRYITTKQDLNPGDILAIEEPFFKTVDSSAYHLRCANCLKSNMMSLIPSAQCSTSKISLTHYSIDKST